MGDNNRYIEVTLGKLWARLNEFDVGSIDTNPGGGGDTFVIFAPKGVGTYTVQTESATQWPNTSYNNAGTLTTMTSNRYAVLWFYLTTDGTLNMLYGSNQYTTVVGAENEGTPSALPSCLEYGGILIGRLIFQKGATTAEEVQSVLDYAVQLYED